MINFDFKPNDEVLCIKCSHGLYTTKPIVGKVYIISEVPTIPWIICYIEGGRCSFLKEDFIPNTKVARVLYSNV